jgi:CheY-like chemotaxis protein
MNSLKTIMLIDDNPDDNFIHKRAINKLKSEITVLLMSSATEALEYIKSVKHPPPDLIFLDINMPGMNGWEFLEAYNQLNKDLHCNAVITMLTTSQNPDDEELAKKWNFVSAYITKPLTPEIFKGIISKYFK